MSSPTEQVIAIEKFGGLNQIAPPQLIDNSELQVCTNFLFGPGGELIKRPGFVLKNGTTFAAGGSPRILGQFDGSAVSALIATGSAGAAVSHIYESEDSGVTWNDMGALSSTADAYWGLQYRDIYYIGDSAGTIRKLTSGFTYSSVAGSPQTRAAILHKDRIFAAEQGAGTLPSRLRFSDPLTGVETWPAVNNIDINAGDGDYITGFAEVGDQLIIFKRYSTWSLYVQGDSKDDWVLRRVNSNIGSYGGKMYEENGIVYFVSPSGIYKMDGHNFIRISDQIYDPRVMPVLTIAPLFARDAQIIKWKDSIVFYGFHGSNVYYVYHLKTGNWSKFSMGTGTVNTIFAKRRVPLNTDSGLILSGGGKVYFINDDTPVYQDDGVSYTATARTKDFTLGDGQLTRFKWASAEYKSPTTGPTFQYFYDDASATTVTGGITANRKGFKISGPGARTRKTALEIRHAANSEFELYRMSMHVHRKRSLIGSGTP